MLTHPLLSCFFRGLSRDHSEVQKYYLVLQDMA